MRDIDSAIQHLKTKPLPNSLIKLLTTIRRNGGTGFLVGGWVRDSLMGIPNYDYDIEVFDIEESLLKNILAPQGHIELVGESFGIFKVHLRDNDLERYTIDVSLPRTERKVSVGHKGFITNADPKMHVSEACRRRDITINSMLYDPLGGAFGEGDLWDCYGGLQDLKQRVIRVVDPETFVEDSLRVLRAMQFAARFNFTIDQATVELCKSIDLIDLPAERLWGEIEKWFLSKYPSVGAKYFVELGIYKLFKSIDPLLYLGDFGEDTLIAICKDIGKAMDFFLTCEGRPSHNGYKQALFLCFLSNLFYTGADFEKFLDMLKVYTIDGYDVRKKVMQIVMNPSIPRTDSEIRRESVKKDLQLFFDFKICENVVLDNRGLTTSLVMSEYRAKELKCCSNSLQPLLSGKHVIELGVPEGKKVGEICKAVFEIQLDGEIETVEEAIMSAREYL